jgi:hypothetical protein
MMALLLPQFSNPLFEFTFTYQLPTGKVQYTAAVPNDLRQADAAQHQTALVDHADLCNSARTLLLRRSATSVRH